MIPFTTASAIGGVVAEEFRVECRACLQRVDRADLAPMTVCCDLARDFAMLFHRLARSLPSRRRGCARRPAFRTAPAGRRACDTISAATRRPSTVSRFSLTHVVELPLDAVEARVDRAEEVRFFLLDDAGDALRRFDQFRIQASSSSRRRSGTSLCRNGSRRPIWRPSSTARRSSRLTTYFSLLRPG